MRVALIQMLVTADKAANLRSACEKIRAAKQAGADIAVLPEMFCCPYENRCFRAYGEEAGGEVQQTFELFGSVIKKLQKAAVRKIHCIYSSLCAKI